MAAMTDRPGHVPILGSFLTTMRNVRWCADRQSASAEEGGGRPEAHIAKYISYAQMRWTSHYPS